ncbi:MAG: protein phosphatase 2C domain-containing protein, partial [archaeon]|nr:protein phosphatase 2C domain-containing protein [archaeon]
KENQNEKLRSVKKEDKVINNQPNTNNATIKSNKTEDKKTNNPPTAENNNPNNKPNPRFKKLTPKEFMEKLIPKGILQEKNPIKKPKKTKVVTIAKYQNKEIRKYLEKKEKNNLIKPKNNNPNNPQEQRPHIIEGWYFQDNQNVENQKTMEDFHCCKENLVEKGSQTVHLFCIFDGHGGAKAAVYCRDNFINVMQKSVIATCYDYPKCFAYAYNKINTEMLQKMTENNIGTTASTVLVTTSQEDPKGREIHCGNVGDSKIYLLQKNGNCILMSKDHNCQDAKEVERIKSKGGMVFNGRVFGSLMLTRSLGDKEMKQYGVISEPYVSNKKITDEDNYIVIASDGIWDVIKEEDLSIYAQEDDMGAEALAKRLVLMALERGTTDNISCIAVKL